MDPTLDPMAAIRVTFFQECDEQLGELEVGLLAMEAGALDAETINAVFRAVHSIKGGAGAFALDDLVRFAHVFETTLDDVRAGRTAADGPLLKLMLQAADVLADLVVAARDGGAVDAAHTAEVALALSSHGELSGEIAGESDADDGDGMDDFGFVPLQIAPVGLTPLDEVAEQESAGPPVWIISFKPTTELYAKANEPALLFRELRTLGVVEATLDTAALPALPDLEPETAYCSWTLRLTSDRDEAAIREVFEWVEDACELTVTLEGAPATPDLDILALIGRAQAEVAAQAMEPAPVAAPPPPPARAPAPPAPPAAAAPSATAADKVETANAPAGGAPTIRVDLERVDRLINLVGELVINQAMLNQRVSEIGLARTAGVALGLEELEQLTREIQDSVMAIRAQPVKSVFQRMPRLVREVASMTGKQVRLITEGEGTEVDKTIIERLTDPLTHMIRNAIDHGLETPETRIAAGKPAEGRVRLSALHRSGRIVIEVSDDGAGINRERVRAIAVEKGVIAPDAQLSDEEIDNLIFAPGFSTADAVSDISGRGVGMDVVKRSIQALGGRITILSTPGRGSTFTLSLPLTLAVLDGMVVTVADQTLVVPLTAIVETLQLKSGQVHGFGDDAQLIAIRDSYVPLIDVGRRLGFRSTALTPTEHVALLVEGESEVRTALLVDAIQGQRQVVIKSLEANYRPVPGIAAATILGDGRVALILDIDAVAAPRDLRTEPRLAATG